MRPGNALLFKEPLRSARSTSRTSQPDGSSMIARARYTRTRGYSHQPVLAVGRTGWQAQAAATSWLAPATSTPGLGSPLPHLRRDWAHPCPICRRQRRAAQRRAAQRSTASLQQRSLHLPAHDLRVIGERRRLVVDLRNPAQRAAGHCARGRMHAAQQRRSRSVSRYNRSTAAHRTTAAGPRAAGRIATGTIVGASQSRPASPAQPAEIFASQRRRSHLRRSACAA